MSTPNPSDEVQELTGSESGRWRVFTQGSSHLFDFEAGTVTRIPGPKSWPGANDRPRPIRSIEKCEVGDRGYWTMKTDGWSPSVDYWWHSSSVIRKIARETDSVSESRAADSASASTQVGKQEEWPSPGQGSTAGLADDGEGIPDLVAHLRETLGVQPVGDLGGATGEDDVESWAKGIRVPRGDGMARLYLTDQVVRLLERSGVSAERIARWFMTANRSLSDMTPAELILDMEPGPADRIVNEAAQRFVILGR